MDIPQQLVNALWLGSVYSLFALGYALVFSVLGLLNLSHSAVFMWGAYLGWVLVTRGNMPLPVAFVLALTGAGLMSVAVDRIAFYPLRQRNAPRMAQLISSIGAAAILVRLSQLMFGAQPVAYPAGVIPTQTISGLPFRVTPIQVTIFVIALGLMALLRWIVLYTKQGQAMRAVAFNEQVAAMLGVPVDWIFMLTFFLAGASAGVAGMLYGLAYNSITPFMGDAIALKGLTVIVLGGMGSIEGAVAGGFVVAALEVFSVALGGSTYRDALIFGLLFLILIVRPSGLFGQAESKRA